MCHGLRPWYFKRAIHPTATLGDRDDVQTFLIPTPIVHMEFQNQKITEF